MIPTMTMGEAFKRFWKNGLVFTGRSRRREYWLSALANFLLMIPVVIILSFTAAILDLNEHFIDVFSSIFGFIYLVPSTALTVRRFHDVNMTGKIPVAISIFFAIYMLLDVTPINDVFIYIMITGFLNLVTGIFEFVIACIDGTAGPNKYGEDPKRMIVNGNL